jgi:hypothetical protein
MKSKLLPGSSMQQQTDISSLRYTYQYKVQCGSNVFPRLFLRQSKTESQGGLSQIGGAEVNGGKC